MHSRHGAILLICAVNSGLIAAVLSAQQACHALFNAGVWTTSAHRLLHFIPAVNAGFPNIRVDGGNPMLTVMGNFIVHVISVLRPGRLFPLRPLVYANFRPQSRCDVGCPIVLRGMRLHTFIKCIKEALEQLMTLI